MQNEEANLIAEILKIGTCEIKEVRESEGVPYLISICLLSTDDMPNYEYLFSEAKRRSPEVIFLRDYPKVTIILPSEEAREALRGAIDRKYYMIPMPSRDMLTIIVKLTARCNLNCSYCYDRDFRKKLSHLDHLSLEDMEKLISMAASYAKKVKLILHGGEPTLAGEAYIRHIAEEILPKYPYADFDLSMQTNGILLTGECIEMLKRNNINIGISYNALHEELRFSNGEEKKVLLSMERLKEEGVSFGIIDVITNESYVDIEAIYDFYKSRNISACLNLAFATSQEKTTKYALGEGPLTAYEREVEKYFRAWIKDGNAARERFASMYISLLLTGQGECCHHGFSCTDGEWMAINVDGSIFPCDGDFPEKYLLGYLQDIGSLYDIFGGASYIAYRDERNEKLKACRSCVLFDYCTGGCPENDIMKCGSAAKKDTSSCRLFRANLLAAYSALGDVTIDEINPILRRLVIEGNCLLPSEIQDFLDYIKIPQDMLTYTFDRSFEDENFELFRLFNNPIPAERLTEPAYPVMCEDGEEAGDMRFEALRCAFEKIAAQVKMAAREMRKEGKKAL